MNEMLLRLLLGGSLSPMQFCLMCRASDYYSRSSSGKRDRHRDREPDKYQSDKSKPVAPAQVVLNQM